MLVYPLLYIAECQYARLNIPHMLQRERPGRPGPLSASIRHSAGRNARIGSQLTRQEYQATEDNMSEKRTLQKEDLLHLHFLNGAELSPDRAQIVYAVNKINAEKDKEFSTIFMLNLASGERRQMTSGKAVDAQPRWSPDGKSIAFISNRGGKPQLYAMPVDGGEARQLTAFTRGIGGSFAWSPDGSAIAFSAVKDADAPNLAREAYRVDRIVYRFDAIGYLDDAVKDIYILDLAGLEAKQLTRDRCDNGNPRWSPDGRTILYEAAMRPNAARTLAPDLMSVNLDGERRSVLEGWDRIGGASFTPDGARIVFVGRPNDGKPIGSKSDLYTLELSSGDIECRTSALDVGLGGRLTLDMPIPGLSLWNVHVSEDSRFAYASVQRGGSEHIYRIALSGDEACEALTDGDCAVFPQSISGGSMLFAKTTLNSPPDLYLADTEADTTQQLTDLNGGYLSGLAMPETQRLQWKGIDGVKVEGWFMKPAHGEAPYPTILYIHGGPHAAFGYGFHFDFQMLAGAGYGVLFLNHRASTGYGDAFSTAIKGDWGNLDYQDLMTGVDHAIQLGLADADRLGVCGLSGGGNLTCWTIGQTDRFKAAIPQNPVTNWRSFYGTSDIGIYFGVEQMGGHPHEIPKSTNDARRLPMPIAARRPH